MTPFTRRSFLRKAGLGGLGGLTLPAWFPRLAFSATPSPQRDVLIAVFLRGAADGLNIVVPFGDAGYLPNRPTLGIKEPSSAAGTAVNLDGFFGLHPSLAPLKELYDDKVLAAVHA
ncbi:MAG TPA: twin-arginine translocation signal domain-containing protein, partial [Thermoanaerobaculia bacterium]